MANNFDRFRAEYNTLHDVMKQKAKKVKLKSPTTEFDALRQHLLQFNETVQYYDTELTFINKLRNVLIHEEKTIEYILADPSIEIIDRMINIRKKILSPDDASIFFNRNIYSLNTSDKLTTALKIINEKQISQFPLFSDSGLIGIISDNGITNWLATQIDKEPVNLNDVTLLNVINEASDEDYKNFKVINPSTLLFDVMDIYSDNLKLGKHSFVILISEKKNVKKAIDIKGIITPWDIQKIREKIEI